MKTKEQIVNEAADLLSSWVIEKRESRILGNGVPNYFATSSQGKELTTRDEIEKSLSIEATRIREGIHATISHLMEHVLYRTSPEE